MAAARPAAVGGGAPPAAPGSPAVIEPVPMSAVAGEWKDKEVRNQEVLMSLNHTQWACHFTTTANITSCTTSDGARWETWVKVSPGNFSMGLGFIGAGNDLKPAANTTVKECLSVCSDSAACKAVSFMQSHADENKTDAMVKCYWKTTAGYTKQKSNCVAEGGPG